jgi:hypothetical protein
MKKCSGETRNKYRILATKSLGTQMRWENDMNTACNFRQFFMIGGGWGWLRIV